MPAVATIRQIAYQAFLICLNDRELFSKLVRVDVIELGYSKIIVALVNRMALMLFDHWMTNGVEANYLPAEFLELYSAAFQDD